MHFQDADPLFPSPTITETIYSLPAIGAEWCDFERKSSFVKQIIAF